MMPRSFTYLAVLLWLVPLSFLPARAELIQGFVEDTSGTPVPGVSVKFTGQASGSQPTVVTDANGFYGLSAPPDTYRAAFIPDNATRLVSQRLFDIVVATDLTVPDVILEPGVLVEGLITNASGTPVANVDLTFEDRSSGNDVFTPNDDTDATGRYAVVVPVADYDIEISPPPFPALVPRLLENVAIAGDVELPTVVLESGVAVNGTVRDPQAGPVESVRLEFYDATTGNEIFTIDDRTNEFGVYRVVVLPGTYDVLFLPPTTGRLLPEFVTGVVVVGDTTLADVVLDEGFELTGLVTDEGDNPIAGVDLDVYVAGTSDRLVTPGDDTGADGRYRLVVPAGIFDLRYNPPAGSMLLRVWVYGVEITGDLERPDVVLRDGYRVTGRLLDGDGAPVAGVDLDFDDVDTGERLTLSQDDSGPDGTFAITVPPGTYDIRFAPPQVSNFLPFILENETIDADRDFGDLTLDDGWGISGLVLDEALVGVGDVDIDVLRGGQNVYIEYDRTAEDGSFRVVVPADTYRVWFDPGAASPLFPAQTDPLVVMADVDLGQIVLTDGVLVDGAVEDQFGAPVMDVPVVFSPQDGADPTVRQTTTDMAGLFALRLAEGSYDVEYLPPSGLYSGLQAGTFALETDTTLPTAVLERQSLVTGRAVDSTGAGVPNVDVDLLEASSGVSVPLQGDLTDAAGFFAVGVADGTYRVRLEPSPQSGVFPFTSDPVVVSGDTDVGELILPDGALVSGIVVDPVGEPIQDVQIGVIETVAGAPKSHLATTNRAGEYAFLVAPGTYDVWFDPPAGSVFFPTELGPFELTGTVALPPTVLERGWFVSGRVLDGGGAALGGVDIDILDEVTGESLPLSDDVTLDNGQFDILVHAGTYRVRVEPDPLTRLLPLVSDPLTVGPDADLGDLMLASGWLVEGDVSDTQGQPIAGVDLDLVDTATQLEALLVGDRTEATGHFATAVTAGDYRAEFRPPRGTRWLPARTGPHAIAQDTLLPPVTLESGFLVSGTVVDALSMPLVDVSTRWLVAGGCDEVFTVRDSTDASGRFEVALAAGSYDVILDPPSGSGLQSLRLSDVLVVDQDVVVPTQILTLDGPPLERCNGLDDDCDGTFDEDYPELGGTCSVGVGACAATGALVCSVDGAGTTCDALPNEPSPEVCDGIDNDCDGTVDDACADIQIDLRLDGGGLSWSAQGDAVHFDIVRGDLGALRSAGFGAAGESCLADDATDAVFDDGVLPSAGEGAWYLVRGNTVDGAGSWGTEARNAGITVCLP